jgi:zinc/manganese transport system permease protein
LFAIAVTASVQLVGIYLVFASLIIPALATRKVTGVQRLLTGYGMGAAAYAIALLISSYWDLPTGAVIVWSLAALGLLLQPALNIVCKACNK